MSQRRTHSAAEACASTATGFAISYLLGLWLYPALGWNVTPAQNLEVIAAYTVVSLLRQYTWRRIFNWIQEI